MDREIQVYVIHTTVFLTKNWVKQTVASMSKFHIQLDIPFMGNVKRILHYTK